ncbi:MAG: hypothetical protein JXD22_06245 [Sedimentisphaerales bacterium]|nr:hypothetical protein [Sedimentisphaerales bacterium]
MRTKKKKPIDWLFPKVRKQVLGLLLSETSWRWYLRDISRRTGLSLGAVRRELCGLAQAEIISKTKDGNRTYYQANTDCPFLAELSGMMRKTAGLTEVMRETLNPLSKKIKVAFIYGSFADNSAGSISDVDLMVIGSVSLREVVNAISVAQEKLGREINPTVYPVKEWQEKLSSGHHFVSSVAGTVKIFIKGNEDDLARLT